jgi:hypothetical protein
MPNPFKYDIALSFSEKDIIVAGELSKALQSYSVNLRTFHYEEKGADQYGYALPKRSIEVYMENSRHALVLASKNYDTGGWASFEWNLIKAENEKRPYRYLLIVKLDDTHIKGLSEDMVFRKWNSDPFELANLIHQVVDSDKQLSDTYGGDPTKSRASRVSKWIKALIITITKDITVKIIVSLVTSVLLIFLATDLDWIAPIRTSPLTKPADSTGTEPTNIPIVSKTTDLILTRSERYAGMNVYVNDERVAVFREYTVTIPNLKLDSKIEVGTDTNKEFILKINQKHLQNESFKHFIE